MERPFVRRDRGGSRRWGLVVRVLLAGLVGGAADALEVDPYYSWGRSPADASEVVNAKFDLEIRAAVVAAEERLGRPPTCEQVTRAVYRRLASKIFQPIDLWAVQTTLLERVPAGGDETLEYRRNNLYSDAAFLDIGMWMPITPTIQVDGVLIGIDKLSHFVSSGWRYRAAYLRARRDGLDAAAAQLQAIRWGILEERTINGSLSTGVLSRGDLEANHGGMRFYLELCAEGDPILALEGGRWEVVRPFDIRRYVGPEWDEGYQPSVFSGYRWRRVRPRLVGYCPRLAEPVVREQLARYQAADRVTPTEVLFQDLVAEGKVEDPDLFGLLANCTEQELPARSASAGEASLIDPGDDSVREDRGDELRRALLELELDRPLRVVGLVSLSVDRPKGLSGSIGAIFAHPRRTDDCREVCLLRGPYLQADLGTTGGQLSVGYGSIVGDTGSKDSFVTAAYLAVGIEAAVLRTWGGSPLEPEAQTLAGIEGQLSIARVALKLGVFGRVSDADHGDRWVVTGGVGWGF